MACGELILEGVFSHFNLYNDTQFFCEKSEATYNRIVPSSGHGKAINRHIIFLPILLAVLSCSLQIEKKHLSLQFLKFAFIFLYNF